MAKKKKIVKTSESQLHNEVKKKKKVITTKPAASRSKTLPLKKEMVFGANNFKWVGIGVLLIALGMILMVGGFNDDPAVWDESKIYGFQRTVLAPVVILIGLGIQFYAIFVEK